MVDLPEPVGPVTRTIPKGLLPISRTLLRAVLSVIRVSRPSWVALLSRIRNTTFSPKRPGSVLTRKSTTCWRKLRRIRPSWGNRRSAMSRSAMILKREVTAGTRFFGRLSIVRKTPSWRKRTSIPSCWGSTWISLAPPLMASAKMRFTRLKTGDAVSSPDWASRSSMASALTWFWPA